MAPETFSTNLSSICADIFSLGMVFQELILNSQPYRTPEEINSGYVTEIQNDIRQNLETLYYLHKACCKFKPSKRITINDIIRELEKICC